MELMLGNVGNKLEGTIQMIIVFESQIQMTWFMELMLLSI